MKQDRRTAVGAVGMAGMAAAMALAAQLLGERELLFPEAAALCLGTWVAPRQPWRVNRRQLVVLMTVSAVGGVLLVRYLPGPLFLRTAAGLAYAGALLTISGTTLIPLISACILPVFLGTDTWAYPVAVCVLVTGIALGQWALERAGLGQAAPTAEVPPLGHRARHWAKTMAALCLLCLLPTGTREVCLAAPPLLVTFAELFFPHSPLRQKPGRVWAVLTCAMVVGFLARLLNLYLGVPAALCVLLAVAGTLLVFRWAGLLLPPAAAAALLPMLLPLETVLSYPVLGSIGAMAFMGFPGALNEAARPGQPAEHSRISMVDAASE